MTARSTELANAALDEHASEIRREISRRQSVHEDYAREMGDEVRRLGAILEEQRGARIAYGERIAGTLEGEFQKVHEAIVAEQKLRFEAEGTMLHMVEDVCQRIRDEVRQERAQREAVQGKLLGLL